MRLRKQNFNFEVKTFVAVLCLCMTEMKFYRWCLWSIFCFTIPPALSRQQKSDLTPPDLSHSFSRLEHFKFKRRHVGGKNIAAISLKLDPERGRRSILVPDGEGFLHSYSSMRHKHGFRPPFEDEEKLVYLNHSINTGTGFSSFNSGLQPTSEREALLSLAQIEKSLAELQGDLKGGRSKEGNSKGLWRRRRIRKRGRGRKDKKKKRRRKGRKKEKYDVEGNSIKMPKRITLRRERTKLFGQEACQFKALKKCARRLGLFKKKDVLGLTDNERCGQRKEFLRCVERQRDLQSCRKRSVARGNATKLRTWIKKLFWTSSSCLLTESMNRR